MMLLPLRENWALPLFWAQLLLLAGLLERGDGRGLRAFSAATLGLLLSWQFAPFVLVLEELAIGAAFAVRAVPRESLRSLSSAFAAAAATALVLHAGNPLLLHSPFVALTLATFAIMRLPRF